MEKRSNLQKLKKKFLYYGSAVAFVAALILYIVCVDPGASLWDCPEYIVGAYRLEIGHPPGNPTWMLVMNFISGFVSDPARIAFVINLTNCVATALAVALLFQTIFFLLSASLFRKNDTKSLAANAVASLCGALVFAWSDSTIFSAVEAEVYALSLLSTAFMVWLMLKWAIDYRAGISRPRYLILLGYVAGLSFGIHELSLLTFTTLFLIYVFARNRDSRPWKSWLAVLLSFCVIGFLLLFWIPGIAGITGVFELTAVNSLGAGKYYGAVIFICLLLVFLAALPFLFSRFGWRKLSTAFWAFFFFTVGCFTYLVIPIRGAANPPMNQGDPSDPFSFYSYLTREQYGSKPLFYGKTPYSSMLRIERIDSTGKATYQDLYRKKKSPKYAPYISGAALIDRKGLLTPADSLANLEAAEKGKGYVKYGYTYDYLFEPELNMWFPRLTDSSEDAIDSYGNWAGMTKETMDYVPVSGAVDSLGNAIARYPDGDTTAERKKEKKYRPTYLQQLRYLLSYQIGYMYVRYFMWNFSGRQNNLPATGEIDHGNFITGFDPVDSWMLGDQSLLPSELGSDNPGHNRYFMLPLLFGLLGALGICRFGRNGRRASTIVLSLFLMTGVAIVFYLNQSPVEPRERDYAFLGSFYAFCIWIGFGAALILKGAVALARKLNKKPAFGRIPTVVAVLLYLGLPALVVSQTFDDHNRSGRDSAAEIAVNFLNSLDPDAIVIVEGDNRYFPLVYAQEVLGVRRDVTVVLQSYLPTAWHVAQLQRPGEEAGPVAMTATPGDLLFDAFQMARIGERGTEAPAVEALKELYSNRTVEEIPDLSVETLLIDSPGGAVALNLREINEGKSILTNDRLAVIDIIATNASLEKPRPVYWQADISPSLYKALEKYSVPGLYTRKWVGNVDEEELLAADMAAYEKFMEMFRGKKRGREFDAEPYVASNLLFLRRDAVLLAERLLADGKAAEAREVLTVTLDYWPFELLPPQRFRKGEGKVEELEVVTDLLAELGSRFPDDSGLSAKHKELQLLSEKRRREALKYYESLPAWRRHTVSFPTRSAAGKLKKN